jgi:pimeloyl-ACP methyl ester carboxylesterase
MVAVSAPPYFPEPARAVQRQFSPAMLSQADRARLQRVHVHGDTQIAQLFDWTHRMSETYDDVNFTPPLLSTIAAETLIVFGDRDPLYPVEIALELKQAIPRSFLWVVPNAGHGPVFGPHAASFAATALGFLRGEWR